MPDSRDLQGETSTSKYPSDDTSHTNAAWACFAVAPASPKASSCQPASALSVQWVHLTPLFPPHWKADAFLVRLLPFWYLLIPSPATPLTSQGCLSLLQPRPVPTPLLLVQSSRKNTAEINHIRFYIGQKNITSVVTSPEYPHCSALTLRAFG